MSTLCDSLLSSITGQYPQAARDWADANPTDPAAVHVRAALASAWRYERLCVEQAAAAPGTRVVLGTLGEDRRVVVTSPSRLDEERIAVIMYEFWFGDRKVSGG